MTELPLGWVREEGESIVSGLGLVKAKQATDLCGWKASKPLHNGSTSGEHCRRPGSFLREHWQDRLVAALGRELPILMVICSTLGNFGPSSVCYKNTGPIPQLLRWPIGYTKFEHCDQQCNDMVTEGFVPMRKVPVVHHTVSAVTERVLIWPFAVGLSWLRVLAAISALVSERASRFLGCILPQNRTGGCSCLNHYGVKPGRSCTVTERRRKRMRVKPLTNIDHHRA